MQVIQVLICVCGGAALARAWAATRGTALHHALYWGMVAWAGWCLVLLLRLPTLDLKAGGHPDQGVYVALCLTACAGVAVLGARRPQVAAWDFVVLGLLAVMLLPLVESSLIGAHSLDWMRITFLAITLGISVLNYLPTRFGPAALLLGLGCAVEVIGQAAPTPLPRGWSGEAARLGILAAPAVAWMCLRFFRLGNDLNGSWLAFRDRWGVVWGQRVREQFNRAAANANWPVTLTWFGFQFQQPPDGATGAAVRETLEALLQRFVAVKRPVGGNVE